MGKSIVRFLTNQFMKTVKEQIFSFLQANPSVYHGGQLQRMDFKTRRGGLATGDSIKRRLNELVAERRISVSPNEHNEAMFSIKEEHKKKIRQIIQLPPSKEYPTGAVREIFV